MRLGDVARIADAAVGDQRDARSFSAVATMSMAVICGTPTPATMRVVQIEPGPDADLDRVGAGVDAAHAPPRRVTMLPPMTWTCRIALLDPARRGRARLGMTVGGVDDDHVDAGFDQRLDALVRCRRRRRRPRRRAGARARPCRRSGCRLAFWMSLTVIMPRSWKPSLTTSTFSIRCLCSSSSTSSWRRPRATVTSRSFAGHDVATPDRRACVSKRRSRLVTMPTSLLAVDHRHAGDVVGAGQRHDFADRGVGRTVIGSLMTPALELLDQRALRRPAARRSCSCG